MRLWFSVTALLILTCIILEVSAVKSNRGTADSTKDKHKSTNSKEVRYAKNKNSGYKKEGTGKEQEVIKERKQRHKREENQKIDYSNEVSKKNRNESGKKVTHEEQKNRKPNEQGKFVRSQDNVKVDKKKFKEPEDSVKKHKRSTDIEQPAEGSLIHDAGKENLKINPALRKEKSKNEFNKKTSHGVAESHDDELNGDAVVNNDQVADDKSCKESAPSVKKNDGDSKKKKIVKDQQGSSKKIKRQVHADSIKLNKENTSSKKRRSTEKRIPPLERSMDGDIENGEDLISTPENSYYLNEDGVIKEKKSGIANTKKYKFSKLSSDTASECKYRENGCKISASDTQRHKKQKLEKYDSDVCNLKVEYSIEEDEIYNEKLDDSVDDTIKSGTVDLDQEEEKEEEEEEEQEQEEEQEEEQELEEQEEEEEDDGNEDTKSTKKNELQDETLKAENCVREE